MKQVKQIINEKRIQGPYFLDELNKIYEKYYIYKVEFHHEVIDNEIMEWAYVTYEKTKDDKRIDSKKTHKLIEIACSGCGTKYEPKFIHPTVGKNAADCKDYCPFCYADYLFRVGK